jgi:hypothetical protein
MLTILLGVALLIAWVTWPFLSNLSFVFNVGLPSHDSVAEVVTDLAQTVH